MKTRRQFLGGAVVVFAVLVVVALWLLRPPTLPPPGPPLLLPDGSSVWVMTVTYGTRHRIGPPLAHVLERLPLPVRRVGLNWGGRHAAMRFSADTPQPALVVWVRRDVPATNSSPPRNFYWCQLANEHGVRVGEAGPAVGYPLEWLPFEVFPRDSRELQLHFFARNEDGTSTPIGQLRFANPRFSHRAASRAGPPAPAHQGKGAGSYTPACPTAPGLNDAGDGVPGHPPEKSPDRSAVR
ncbi:MAG: hypothetical protein ACK45B_12600 [Limisphaerales bacterium]